MVAGKALRHSWYQGAHHPEKKALVQDTKESSGVLSPAALCKSRSQAHRSQAGWTTTAG